ncbi:oxidoreductase [Leisingera sp. ANG-M1]|uniref:SDR family oxidoreductase n=1 Tax=Leisingera sp. ANG-M1 TaxID=1577895 RepID=UPI00057EB624|nr:SDR family oxidoreductase [Leisingera sp. ANG-M1]KIC10703.1 oxidoreductase [Leisingera sp. ANG-M1]
MAGKDGRVLVLGAYGFIGAEVLRNLLGEGFEVAGLGRNPQHASRVLSGVPFVKGDLLQLLAPEDWAPLLRGVEAVVNCAGVLQDMAPGELEAVHHTAIAALGEACAAAGVRVIQVSAAGAGPEAKTEFMRSKARGDAALLASGAQVHVLRPGLVIGQGAFGGTRLLRMLAAVPLVQPVALADAPVQCVGMGDVASAVAVAVRQELPPGIYDLVEDQPQTLEKVLAATRRWLGFAPARMAVRFPAKLLPPVAACADALARLGWRSPMRTTAIAEIRAGVRGDPAPFRAAMGRGMPPLKAIYASLPSGREQRLDARMALLMPVAVAVLSLFWLASGLIGLWQLEAAADVLRSKGWGSFLAGASVVFWSFVDIALGLAVLWRLWAARACLGMVAVSLIYLLFASVITPEMWADPLGPLVKVIPGILLALITLQLLEER